MAKNRLQEFYNSSVKKELQNQFKFKSIMQVPRLQKVVINMGLGNASMDSKKLEDGVSELTLIAGQKPVITKAKKAIATFKVREGMGIGAKVTLRGENMWAFVDKLFNIAIPRIRDFRGVSSRAFDGRGNYTLGIKEQIIFPEIDFDKVKNIRGFDITFVTSTDSDEEARALLTMLGMPFIRQHGVAAVTQPDAPAVAAPTPVVEEAPAQETTTSTEETNGTTDNNGGQQ